MEKFIRIGGDLATNYFQVHALTGEDGQPMRRKLSRQGMHKFFPASPPALRMEACASSPREFSAMGHDVRPIPPVSVKPYVKRGKNDAADAAAICEAVSRRGPALRSGQERREPSDADAAQDARTAHQAEDD